MTTGVFFMGLPLKKKMGDVMQVGRPALGTGRREPPT